MRAPWAIFSETRVCIGASVRINADRHGYVGRAHGSLLCERLHNDLLNQKKSMRIVSSARARGRPVHTGGSGRRGRLSLPWPLDQNFTLDSKILLSDLTEKPWPCCVLLIEKPDFSGSPWGTIVRQRPWGGSTVPAKHRDPTHHPPRT